MADQRQKESSMVRYSKIKTTLEQAKTEIAKAVVQGMDPDRQIAVALALVRANPKVLDCSPTSIASSVLEATRAGLSLNPQLEHGYLIPYWSKAKNSYECHFQMGYRGEIYLAMKYRIVKGINAQPVFERDAFSLDLAQRQISHKPFLGTSGRGEVVGAYAIAILPDGTEVIEWVDRPSLDKIRACSRESGEGSIWDIWFDQQAAKSAVHRLYKRLGGPDELANVMAVTESTTPTPEQPDGPVFDSETGEIIETTSAPAPEKSATNHGSPAPKQRAAQKPADEQKPKPASSKPAPPAEEANPASKPAPEKSRSEDGPPPPDKEDAVVDWESDLDNI